DASFISLSVLAAPIARLLLPGATLVALVKPQFEAGRLAASKGRGGIRDPVVRQEAIGAAHAAGGPARVPGVGGRGTRDRGAEGERGVLPLRGASRREPNVARRTKRPG